MIKWWRGFWAHMVRAAHQDLPEVDYQRSLRGKEVGEKATRQAFEELLRFCEFVGVMAVLFALSPKATGVDHWIVVGLMVLLWVALGGYVMSLTAPKEPLGRRMADWPWKWLLCRFIASLLIALLAIWAASRISLVAATSSDPPSKHAESASMNPSNPPPPPKPSPAPRKKRWEIGPPD